MKRTKETALFSSLFILIAGCEDSGSHFVPRPELSRDNPYGGIGKLEPLKHAFSRDWSRRITVEHRLIYRIVDDRIGISQARYHYK